MVQSHVSAPTNASHRPLVVVAPRTLRAPGKPGLASPRVSIGVGWGVYLYVNRGNLQWLASIGFAGASGVVCGWLAPTGAGAFACAAGAAVIWSVILRYAPWIPSYDCLEMRFAGGLSTKLVQRSC